MRLHDILRCALCAYVCMVAVGTQAALFVSNDFSTCFTATTGECATVEWQEVKATWTKAPSTLRMGNLEIHYWSSTGTPSNVDFGYKFVSATPNSGLTHLCSRANVELVGTLVIKTPDRREKSVPWTWTCDNSYQMTPTEGALPANGLDGIYVVSTRSTEANISPYDTKVPLDTVVSAYLYVTYEIHMGRTKLVRTKGYGFGAGESYVPSAKWEKAAIQCIGVSECTASNELVVGTDSAPVGTKFTVKHDYIAPSGELHITKLNADGTHTQVDMSEHSIVLNGGDYEQVPYNFNVKGNGSFSIPVNTTVTYP